MDGEITPIAITIPGAAYPILEKFIINESILILKIRLVKIINTAKVTIVEAPINATLKLLNTALTITVKLARECALILEINQEIGITKEKKIINNKKKIGKIILELNKKLTSEY